MLLWFSPPLPKICLRPCEIQLISLYLLVSVLLWLWNTVGQYCSIPVSTLSYLGARWFSSQLSGCLYWRFFMISLSFMQFYENTLKQTAVIAFWSHCSQPSSSLTCSSTLIFRKLCVNSRYRLQFKCYIEQSMFWNLTLGKWGKYKEACGATQYGENQRSWSAPVLRWWN